MASPHSAALWSGVHEERLMLAHDLESLRPEQWAARSLCSGWDVHDVLAHLIDSSKSTRLAFIARLVAARFDFDRDNAIGVRRERAATPAETLAEFRRVITRTSTPPAPLASRMVEVIVHGEDIRVPLGIERRYPTEHLAAALAYQISTPASFGGGRERAAGVRVIATDSDLRSGTGAEVSGSTLTLLLAVSGRPVNPAAVSGAGAASFLLQCGAA